jgi:hypothetical protein
MLTSISEAATFNVTIMPREQDANGEAHYRLWIPDEVETLRGIIVRQHGCGPGARKLGLEHADDPQWQALAKKWDCALLGSQLWAPEEDCSTWTIPADGSASSFFRALDYFADKTGHPEVKHVPWCLWGHSGGAMWVCNMTYLYPERVIATFPRSGGLAPLEREFKRSQPQTFDSSPEAYKVPILFCFGETEEVPDTRFYNGVAAARQLFEHGRKHGAPWSIAVHPGSNHENSNSRLLAVRYFDAAMKYRLPEAVENPKQPIAPLNPDYEKSFVADVKTFKLFRENEYPRDTSAMAWFPNIHAARAWQELSRRGSIADGTPPPAPTEVTLTKQGAQWKLTWKAEADVESGIGSFRIYRGQEMIGEVKGPVDKRWNPHGHYHAWNYSDQPLQGTKFPPKEFVVKAAPGNLSVTTVNQSGIESGKTKAAVSEPDS